MTKQNQITKNQHWVPEFYLEQFSDEKNFLEILDVIQKKIIKRKPYPGVCYNKFFYAKKTGKQDEVSQTVESYFQKMESEISSEWKGILNKIIQYKPFDSKELEIIAVMASMLMIRSDAFRNDMNSSLEDLNKEIIRKRSYGENFQEKLKEIIKEKNDENLDIDKRFEEIMKLINSKEYRVEFDNALHLNFLKEIPKFANHFLDKKWRFYLKLEAPYFITMDNPVCEWFEKPNHVYGVHFMERDHYLALSPEILLVFSNPLAPGKKIKRKRIYDSEAIKYNLIRANLTSKYCYAKNKTELENILDAHEYYKNRQLKSIIGP